MITFGAVLGRASLSQLTLMVLLETALYSLNAHIVFYVIGASDIGGSLVIHAFGAFFGLGVAATMGRRRGRDASLLPSGHAKNGSDRTSDR